MKRAILAVSCAVLVWGVFWAAGRRRQRGTQYGPASGITAEAPGDRAFASAAMREVMAAVASWPPASQRSAKAMLEKYGLPDQAAARRLVWNENGPWKRTIVHRDGGEAPLEQSAAYRVPNERFGVLARVDGSVSAERGGAEISARSADEAMNFLSLNLAEEVISGKRELADARAQHRRLSALRLTGKSSPYTESLLFAEPPAPPPAKTKKTTEKKP